MRRLAAAAAAALMLTATGCNAPGLDPTAAPPTVTVTADPTPESEPMLSDEDIFLLVIEEESPEVYASQPDADLVELGRSMCDGFDAGLTEEDITLIGVGENFDAYDVGVLIGAAQSTFCPEHLN